ncbi:hypothetical protein PMAYCL1PPCAC_26020, partial [Pristionchus mayeri]
LLPTMKNGDDTSAKTTVKRMASRKRKWSYAELRGAEENWNLAIQSLRPESAPPTRCSSSENSSQDDSIAAPRKLTRWPRSTLVTRMTI